MNIRRSLAAAAWLALLALARPAGASGLVEDYSYPAPDGTRVLEQSVVVSADLDAVWRAFTTAEGLKEWAVPSAWMDFRVGGHWETSYDPGASRGDPANIRSRILAYQPPRMLAIQAVQAPPDFPHPELLERLFSVFRFQAVDGGVRIIAAGIGYAEGDGFDELYEFFRRGNAWTLERLHERFQSGPVNWREHLRQLPDGNADDAGSPPDDGAGPPAAAAGLGPLAFLAGQCWSGEFPGGRAVNTHCYTWVYGGRFMRDVHVVEGTGEPYCGETIYRVDPETGAIRFTYYNSLGGVTDGRLEATDDGLFSPAAAYEGPDGARIMVRSWLVPAADGASYVATSERRRNGEWEKAFEVEFERAPGLEPATALAGACTGARKD